jgi:hypothetical protein
MHLVVYCYGKEVNFKLTQTPMVRGSKVKLISMD